MLQTLPHSWPITGSLIFLTMAGLLVFARVILSRWPKEFTIDSVTFISLLVITFLAPAAATSCGTGVEGSMWAAVGLSTSVGLLATCVVPSHFLRQRMRGAEELVWVTIFIAHLILTILAAAILIYTFQVGAQVGLLDVTPWWRSRLDRIEWWALQLSLAGWMLPVSAVFAIVKHYRSKKRQPVATKG